jgi:hypothetical protein
MEQIECSETSAYKIQTPRNYPEENIQYIQQDEMLHTLFYLETALHVSDGATTPSSGAQTTVSTASGISQIVTATCRYRAVAR